MTQQISPLAIVLTIAAALAACTQGGAEAADDMVPVMANYPETFDAIAFTGILRRDEDCIALIGSGGTRYVPIFRNVADATELEREFNLDNGQTVTVNGMNRLPNDAPIANDFRPWAKCGAFFFTYGGIDSGQPKLPLPTNAPTT